MGWTYDPTNLGTADAAQRLNSVRLLVGDTDISDQQMQDEEVTFGLGQNADSIYHTASWSARAISSKYARQVTTSLDGALSADYSDLSKQYKTLADTLEYQAKTQGGNLGIYAGGVSKAALDAVRDNTDRIDPSFRRDRFRNPPNYSGDTDYSSYD